MNSLQFTGGTFLVVILTITLKGGCNGSPQSEQERPSLNMTTETSSTTNLPEVALNEQPGWWIGPVAIEYYSYMIVPDEFNGDMGNLSQEIVRPEDDGMMEPFIISKNPPTGPFDSNITFDSVANTTLDSIALMNEEVPIEVVTESDNTPETDIHFPTEETSEGSMLFNSTENPMSSEVNVQNDTEGNLNLTGMETTPMDFSTTTVDGMI